MSETDSGNEKFYHCCNSYWLITLINNLIFIHESRPYYLFIQQIFLVGWISRTDDFPVFERPISNTSQTSFVTPPAAALLAAPHQPEDLSLRLSPFTAGTVVVTALPLLSTNFLTHFSASFLLLLHRLLIVPLSVGDGSHSHGGASEVPYGTG